MKHITAEMLVEKSKKYGKELTLEQAQAMIDSKSSISDDELASVSGGDFIDDVVDAWGDYLEDCGRCPYDSNGVHDWKETGKTRPGRIFGDSWPDEEMKCTKCGKTGWNIG